MKARTRSRKKNQKVHAKRRALERYDIALSNADLAAIVVLIKRGENALLINEQDNRTSLWLVLCARYDRMIKVVYDRHRESIVTVLSD